MSFQKGVFPLKTTSADDRRTLSEFGIGGIWRAAKYIEVYMDSRIGDHFHKLKDECFLLSKGEGTIWLDDVGAYVVSPTIINVPRGTHHVFNLEKGSILIGLASEEHDPGDDYKI